MRILDMQAAYGRLRGDTLRLEPGLNVICAPNESGKSTWCSFLRTMLYGLPTRQSGPLADKNRYAPWTGEAMQGRMDLDAGGQLWTVLRGTRRVGAPMGGFSCTYTGTSQPVPDITGQNLGETLLGVPREVFQRSAFIGQSALAVTQDPELERRITSLLSTGQEDVSYSESYDRLKKQLNRRRHNKTGLIPALEQELLRMDDALRRQEELAAQLEDARAQLRQAQARLEELEQRQAQWNALEKQEALRQWREAQEDLSARQQQLTALEQLSGDLPDRDALARMQAQLDLLDRSRDTLTQARRTAQQRQSEAQTAQDAWAAHPLYPAEETQLRQQAEAMTPPTMRSAHLRRGAAVCRSRCLRFAGRPCAVHCRRMRSGCCRRLVPILYGIPPPHRRPSADGPGPADSVGAADRRLSGAASRRTAGAGAVPSGHRRRQRSGPAAPAAAGDPAGPGPAVPSRNRRSRRHPGCPHRRPPPARRAGPCCCRPPGCPASLRTADPAPAPAAAAGPGGNAAPSMDSRESLQAQQDQCRARLDTLQAEYDAIALAMEALTQANTVLQTRFSPALGVETARIFSALTAGRYDKVLLDRSLSLSAQPAGDAVPRALALLSQGAGDQLYLAARLAICRMVLPQDKAVPLILDDALANFDDTRMAAALDWLLEESRTRQILLFTCHRREGDYLRDRAHVISLN